MKFIKYILGFLFSKNKKAINKTVKSAKELAESAVEKINQAYGELEESEKKYDQLIEDGKQTIAKIESQVAVNVTEKYKFADIKKAVQETVKSK